MDHLINFLASIVILVVMLYAIGRCCRRSRADLSIAVDEVKLIAQWYRDKSRNHGEALSKLVRQLERRVQELEDGVEEERRIPPCGCPSHHEDCDCGGVAGDR